MTTKTRKSKKHRSTRHNAQKVYQGASRRAEIIDTNADGMVLWKQIEYPGVDCAVCIFEREHPTGWFFWEQGEPILGDASLRFAGVDRAGLSVLCAKHGFAAVAEALSAPAPKGQIFVVVLAADGISIALRDEFDVVNAVDGAVVMQSSPKVSMPNASVSRTALVARIKRKLAHNGLLLRVARGARQRADVGDFYLIDNATGGIADMHVDLTQLGRELGVLAPEEGVA